MLPPSQFVYNDNPPLLLVECYWSGNQKDFHDKVVV
jgi:hypothetical protein